MRQASYVCLGYLAALKQSVLIIKLLVKVLFLTKYSFTRNWESGNKSRIFHSTAEQVIHGWRTVATSYQSGGKLESEVKVTSICRHRTENAYVSCLNANQKTNKQSEKTVFQIISLEVILSFLNWYYWLIFNQWENSSSHSTQEGWGWANAWLKANIVANTSCLLVQYAREFPAG